MEAAFALSPQRRLALTILIMGASLMQVLDTTIANVALPHMQASLGATPETITWVLTSYIVAAAVATPLTGWLEARIGRFSLTLISVAGFTMASMLCGAATSLTTMVAARLMQGLFGAFIGPLSQAIMIDIYPASQRSKAMTIWGMGIMIGPILGPVIGGVLTDSYNWRWVFFVNAPIGLVTTIGLFALMPRIRIPKLPFDLIGFGLLSVALCALQLVLDRGSQLDWFQSTEIILETGIAIAVFWMFVIHSLTAAEPLIPRALIRDRNFVIACLFMMIALGMMMSGSALMPQMLQHLFAYDTTSAGMIMMPRGIAMMLAMLLAGAVVGRIDARLIVAAGMLIVGAGNWIMVGFSLDMGREPVIISGALLGFGVGVMAMPLNLIAFANVGPLHRTNAAAMFSLARNIGGSIAIAIFMALLAHNLQVSHSDLASTLTIARFPYLQGGFAEGMGVESGAILQLADIEINRQATMIAYLDDFWVMTIVSFALLPFVWFLNPYMNKKVDREAMVTE